MKRTLHIEIDSGDTTCYSEPGQPCPHVRVTHCGTRWSCGLFGRPLRDSAGDETGWLLRCQRCLDAEASRPGTTVIRMVDRHGDCPGSRHSADELRQELLAAAPCVLDCAGVRSMTPDYIDSLFVYRPPYQRMVWGHPAIQVIGLTDDTAAEIEEAVRIRYGSQQPL